MFRFLLAFIYVLYILIKSSKSSSVLASFNEPCSNHSLCVSPLICSNASKCICSKSSSIWNHDEKDCFYCPSSWIEWENNHCLSLSVPPEGGLSYDQANDMCHSFSSELFSIPNLVEFKQLEMKINTLLHGTFSSAITIFFRLGAWIDKFPSKFSGLEDIWCNETEIDPSLECIYITRKIFKNGSLCLSGLKCNEQMPFICDMPAISEKNTIDNEDSGHSDQRLLEMLTALAPVALQLLGNLVNPGGQQPAPPEQTPPPQIIVQQPLPVAQDSSDNMVLYIGLGIGGFVLLLLVCCAAGAIIYFTGCLKDSSSTEQTNQRSSIESDLSDA